MYDLVRSQVLRMKFQKSLSPRTPNSWFLWIHFLPSLYIVLCSLHVIGKSNKEQETFCPLTNHAKCLHTIKNSFPDRSWIGLSSDKKHQLCCVGFEGNSSIFIAVSHFSLLAGLYRLAGMDFGYIIPRCSYVGRVLGFRAIRKFWLSNLFL